MRPAPFVLLITRRRQLLTMAAAIIFFASSLMHCNSEKKSDTTRSVTEIAPTYVGAATCKGCHAKQFDDWKKSDHYLAMLPANDSTVLGNFNNQTLSADGIISKFFKKDNKFYINTQGDDGKNHDYEIRYTFGHFPLQQYLIEFSHGRLQATRQCWDSREKRWFQQYPGQHLFHKDWLHWTGNAQNWNTMCATCHSTNLQKNYDFATDTYQTTWSEINVACESCHGPASRHNQIMSDKDYKKGSVKFAGFRASLSENNQSQIIGCMPCHTRKSDISADIIPSSEALDNFIPQIISDPLYYADGQIKDENYEYGSFVQSKMYHKGVKCSNCHNPHSGKIVEVGNKLCMTCHEKKYDEPSHHFHQQSTDASQCINCHMTTRTYMGNDVRRDHSFRVPRPDQSVAYGTPNACNTCHNNKSAAWASAAVNKWYGKDRAYHFSDDLIPGSAANSQSVAHLVKLLADGSQPEIARATAAHYLQEWQTQESVSSLVKALDDAKALVRYHSLRALSKFPPQFWVSAAGPKLSDPVSAVRIAAASLYHQLSADQIPSEFRTAFTKADEENRKFLMYGTDFAIGNVMLADYELQGQDKVNAIKHYLRGLDKDSLMNYARMNLSITYAQNGDNDAALQQLSKAIAIDQSNYNAYFNRALLHVEKGDTLAALNDFRQAYQLKSEEPRLYYNYGLLLNATHKTAEAKKVLQKGFQLFPDSPTLNYALTYVYLTTNEKASAQRHATILKQLDPNNPAYQQFFDVLGIK